MPGWALDLRVDSDLPAGFRVESLREFDFLGERMDSERSRLWRITAGKHRAAIVIHALPDSQGAKLVQSKITHIEAPVTPRPAGELRHNVADAVKIDIVQYDKLVIAARDDILFEVVGTHFVR